MKAKELVDELNRRVTEGASFSDKILCARAADLIEAQAKAIEELRGKFAPIAHYLELRRQKPMDQLGDTIHAVNIGSQWEAELLLSDMINFADALAPHSKEGEQG